MTTRRLVLVVCLILSTIAVIPTGAGASRRQGSVSERVSDPRSSRAAWTPERMRAARPAPMPKIHRADLEADTPAMGAPVVIEDAQPSSARYAAGTATSQTSPRRRPIPFTRSRIEDPSVAPLAAHGIIFGSSDAGDFHCSGTAITSDNRSVVWTAGHCLYFQRQWARDVVFVPGYEKQAFGEQDAMAETAPYGVWAAEELTVPPEWASNENPLYDFGALRTAPNPNGQFLGDVVAARGIAFNQHPTETVQSFGYPALPSAKFDGDHLETCVSQGSGRIWDGMVAMGCDMEQGSSGGGWVIREEFVTSNVSGGNMRVWPNMAFGPYLGDAAKTLYDAIRGGTAVFPQPTPSAPVIKPPQTHRVKTTLFLRYHLTAKGRVTAPDGFGGCVQTAPVQLGRKRDGVFYPVGKLLFTDSEGRFRTKLRDRKGTYVAFVDDSAYDLSNRCAQALAFARHRH